MLSESYCIRRSRNSEGGAHAKAGGLGCETALVASLARQSACAGLAFNFLAMIAVLMLLGAQPVRGQIALAQGAVATPNDILWEEDGAGRNLVLRFIVPEIARDGQALGYSDVSADMDRICNQIAPDLILNTESKIDQILVVFSDQPVPRGQPVPEATQFIAVYSLQDDRCIWEDF